MYKLLRQRYSEVLARKRNGIKLNWLEPPTKAQAEQIAVAYKQDSVGTKANVAI